MPADNQPSTMADLVSLNKQKLNSNRADFARFFGVPLHRFMHPLFGFDVIEFDDWLGTPDGKSSHEFIIEKFGKEADELVEKII